MKLEHIPRPDESDLEPTRTVPIAPKRPMGRPPKGFEATGDTPDYDPESYHDTDVFTAPKVGRPKGSRNKNNTLKKPKKIQEAPSRIDNSRTASSVGGAIMSSVQWLINNPDFDERPATMEEFLGPEYLDIDRFQNPSLPRGVGIRPGVKQALIDIFGDEIDSTCISVARRAMFTGGIGVGKQFDLSVPILTSKGWVKNGDLKVGDFVIGKNGKPTKVLAIFDNESVERYRVHFKDGTWINAGADHKWEVIERKHKRDKKTGKMYRGTEKFVTDTRTLAHKSLRYGDSWKYDIPLVDPVEFDVPFDEVVDAYTLGWYISNGSTRNLGTPKISSHISDIEYIKSNLIAPGCSFTVDLNKERNGASIWIRSNSQLRRSMSNPFACALRDLGLFGVHTLDKFIPKSYLTAPVGVRLELLRGLMDSDGCANQGNRSQFSTSSKLLANDVCELVRGLGGYCTLTSFERMNVEYTVHINMDQVCQFKMPRKARNWKPRTNQKPHRSIVKIEKIEDGPGRCIMVDAPDHLYVAKDYIVSHNSTLAAIALAYMVHWVECLHDPQSYFELLPGSRIAFMLMSTKDSQAREVLFGDIKSLVDGSEWFKKNAQRDTKLKNQLRFPNDIWLLPGNSMETTFEGYNILGGVIDEGDSHKVTKDKDYAAAGWDTIHGRIGSRFTDPSTGEHRGLLMAIGQMKKQDGFMAKKKKELLEDDKAVVVTMTIWESRGWDYYADRATGKVNSFFYDIGRRVIVPPLAAKAVKSAQIIEIPNAYKKDFENDPVKALRDHAGIPPAVEDPFIGATDRVDEAQEKWQVRYSDLKYVVDSNTTRPGFNPDFISTDRMKRAVHVDIAYAAHGDALGMAMGHVPEVIEVDNELKPYIVIDFLLRIKPSGGQQLMLSDFRQIIYFVRDELKFNVSVVTFDGFQSQDSIQIMRQKRFNTDELSVDRNKGPYEDLRQALYERRIEFPKYMTYINKGDAEKVNIIKKELIELTDTGPKIDHPPSGSKDVADALAGVVYVLMGNNAYRRGAAKRPNTPKMVDNIDEEFSDIGEKSPAPITLNPFESYEGKNKDARIIEAFGLPPVENDPFSLLRNQDRAM